MSAGRSETVTRIPQSAGAHNSEHGGLLVEFVLVAPFILFIVGYILYLGTVTQAQQIAMTVSRELATRVYRECADFSILAPATFNASGDDLPIQVDTNATANAMIPCINAARNSILDRWDDILRPTGAPVRNSITLNVEVYRYEFSNFTPPTTCSNATSSKATFLNHNGIGTGITASQILPATLCTRNRMVRANLEFTLTPPGDLIRLISTLQSLVPGALLPSATRTIREETII
jgi:hypothetical protein